MRCSVFLSLADELSLVTDPDGARECLFLSNPLVLCHVVIRSTLQCTDLLRRCSLLL